MVEGDLVLRMGIAKDVPAVAAMVAALEKIEGFVTSSRVADEGVGVRFPVMAGGHSFDRRKIRVFVVLDVFGWRSIFSDLFEGDFLPGGGGRAAADGANFTTGAVEAVSAAVEASGRSERRCAVRSFGRT